MESEYLKKFYELKRKGWELKDIVKNIYFNYSSFDDNDDIFRMKNEIAYLFGCKFKDVQLIGSSKTGYKIDNINYKLIKCSPKDYDFCIIDSNIFSYYLRRIDYYRIDKNKLNHFYMNLRRGKLHVKYLNEDLINDFEQKCDNICKKMKINKRISICIYLDDDFYIDGLVYYFRNVYQSELYEISEKGENIMCNIDANIDLLEDIEE